VRIVDVRIDVIVPQFGRFEKTATLLRSIARAYPRDSHVSPRIILVDDGSLPVGYEMAREAPVLPPGSVVIRNSHNMGFVRATNIGLCASDAEFVVLQNNDTEVYPDLYEAMAEKLLADSSLGAVGPVASETKHSWQSWNRVFQRADLPPIDKPAFVASPHELRAVILREKLRGYLDPVPLMLSFFCCMLRRRAIDQVGLLSTEFGVGFGDDDDYCARLRVAGWGLGLALDAYCRHDGSSTFESAYTPEQVAEMRRKARATLKAKYPEEYGSLNA